MFVFYVFLLAVGAVGALAYVLLFMTHVPGAKDERFGALEPLPDELGVWHGESEPSSSGLLKETRYLLADPGGLDETKLIKQVRYRDGATREIISVEPEVIQKRRRVRSS